jgi:hypothetical protein
MPRGLLQAYAIKKPAFVFGVEDLIHIKDSPTLRLTATPFVHDYEDKVFLGHAAPWKGAKGIETVRGINPGVAAGLEKAISISKACAGEKGVVRVGDRYLPKKVICQIEKAGKKAA